MKYIITRTKDGTGWQTTSLEAFRNCLYLQRHGAQPMFIVAEANTWEEARAVMQKLRTEDYRRHLRRRKVVGATLIALLMIGLWVAWALV